VPVPQAATPAIPGLPLPPGVEPTVPLQFLDTDVKDVLTLYERWTGRRLIYSTQLVGPIRIFVTGQVPQSEAVKIVEMTLAINGFSIVPSEDPKIWKVTGTGMNPKQVGIPFVDHEDMLPTGEQMVMFLFKLKNADPTELAQTVQTGILAASQTGGSGVVALPRAQALLVTENTNIIRTLVKVVRAIDVEPAEVVSEFITLEHAQAEEVATALEKLFEKQQTTTATTPGFPGQARPGQRTGQPTPGVPIPGQPQAAEGNVSIEINGGATGVGPTEDNIVIGKVRITADKRTNRLHVVCRPVNIKLIRALIKEYDAHVPLAPPAVRPLRYRPVEEVVDAVVAAIADPGEKAAGGAAGTTTAGRQGQVPTPTQQQTNRTTGTDRFGSTTGDSSSGTLGESLSTSERDTQPLTQQVGKSTIIGDRRANSIIVIGPPDVTEKIFSLIDRLDVRQAQVMIHTVIGELRLTNSEQFGLEYILRNGGVLPATTTTPGTTTTPSVGYSSTGQAVLNFSGLYNQTDITRALTAGAGGLSGYIAAGQAFAAALQTLESSNRFQVINRPTIFTSNNKRAIITSGEEVPVPTNINSSFNNAGAVNTGIVTNSQVQYKPIELRLEVLPLINSENEVSLEVVQNLSDRAGTTRIDNNDIPNIARRALKTYVTVPNGGTLVLGGLIKETKDLTKSGVPKLINLPVVGPLFGKKSNSTTRTELIVLMRPVVTVAPADPAKLRETMFEAYNVPPDIEAGLIPPGLRQQVNPPKPAPLRGSAPKLREESGGTRRR
jgi:type II secretion system protein D